jgi:hypothetical protein
VENVSLVVKGLGETLIRGFAPYVAKRKTGSYILRCEVTDLDHESLDKRFKNIDAEIGIRRTAGRRNEDKWQEDEYV